jgi:GTP cyclohydrolase I
MSLSAKNQLEKMHLTFSDVKNWKNKDVENILLTLGMDLTDDSLKGTPNQYKKCL